MQQIICEDFLGRRGLIHYSDRVLVEDEESRRTSCVVVRRLGGGESIIAGRFHEGGGMERDSLV